MLERVPEDYVPRPYSEDETREAFDRTIEYWRSWLAKSRYQGRWREVVHRSALTLKLLTYRPTGGIVAAPTTSLPEQLGGGRNWDYRYTWIRDAAFSLYALLRLGFTEEAAAFMDWMRERFREPRPGAGGPLQIMYGIDGRSELEEEVLDHLEGYRGSSPVRIGNGAAEQLQLDIYGELIDSVYFYSRHGSPIDHDSWVDLCRVIDWICENWDQADEGIWEERGGRKHYTYSRLMSWVGLERAVKIALDRGLPADLPKWQASRDQIYHQIMARGWHPERQAFVQHYDTRVPRRGGAAHAARELRRADRPALAVDARRHGQGAGQRQPRLPLQRRGLARRARGRGGHVLDLHVLVRRGAGARRPRRRGAARVREDAHLREPPRASTRRRSA